MNSKTITLLALCALFSIGTANAQLFWQENFTQGVGPLITSSLASSDNSVTNNPLNLSGWLTQSNTAAVTNCFDVTATSLTYNGYAASAIGNALTFNGNAGQSLYKPWDKGIKNDSTVYISFLINIPNVTITGGDFFLGIKMEATATSTNWGSCIYAAVDPSFVGTEITFSIKKSSSGTAVPATTYFATATTHLIVLKYKVGVINGISQVDETGKYDDKMSVFVNPPVVGTEPTTPTMYCADVAQKDLWRWGSTSLFGSAKALYLRSSATGSAPAYTIDAIRTGLTWADVISAPNGMKKTTADNFFYSIDKSKQLIVNTSTSFYSNYNIISLSGQQLLKGSINRQTNKINVSKLKSGIYILNLNGNQQASSKIIIP